MNNDPGHDEAEVIEQDASDDHYGDMADAQSPKPVWTFCNWCMTQRDHMLINKAWLCSMCGKKNKRLPVVVSRTPSLTSSPRRTIIDVAESYLEENPEE